MLQLQLHDSMVLNLKCNDFERMVVHQRDFASDSRCMIWEKRLETNSVEVTSVKNPHFGCQEVASADHALIDHTATVGAAISCNAPYRAILVAPSTCFSPSTAIGPPLRQRVRLGGPYLALSRVHTQVGVLNCPVLNRLGGSTAR